LCIESSECIWCFDNLSVILLNIVMGKKKLSLMLK
jgi:hypothetical protein